MRIRRAIPVAAIVLLLVPWVAAPVSAADVNFVLVASAVEWHVASTGTPSKPTITVNPGDVLRLQVHNHDATDHTFTFPHFGVDRPLASGSDADPTIIFVNLTTSTADNGKWQFYCNVPGHSTGPNESRTGMVGWVQVGPSTHSDPGFEVVLVIAALGVAVVVARIVPRKRT